MKIWVGSLGIFALIFLLSLFGLAARAGAQNKISLRSNGSPKLRGDAEKPNTETAGSTYSVLYDFCSAESCTDGDTPLGVLAEDADGNFYGTTWANDDDGRGTVFELDNAERETVLYYFCSFSCAGGEYPAAGVIRDATGNLYGTTWSGGTGGYPGGTLFKVDTTGQESALYSFCSEPNCTDGANPTGSLIQDAAGNLYGTTQLGGSQNPDCASFGGCGTVFKIDPSGHEKVLYTFCPTGGFPCADGNWPEAGLTLDAAGNLYGTTGGGGAHGGINWGGTVFKLDTTGHETVLYSFCSQPTCTDGANPSGNLIQDAAGNLYGTAIYGGANTDVNRGYGGGVAFKLGAAGNYTVLYNFCSAKKCADGSNPGAGLTQGPAGKLYGTTTSGGSAGCHAGYGFPGCGAIFELDSTGRETVLYSFCPHRAQGCLDGVVPNGLILDAAGNLYGTTQGGGSGHGACNDGCGTVFKFAPSITAFTLTASPNPSQVGQSVTFTAVLTGSYVTPTGSVTFEKGKTSLGTVGLADGQAQLTATFAKSGNFTIKASYSGDQIYQEANSKRFKQVVGQ